MTRGIRNELANKRFGHLVALSFVGVDSSSNALWSCKCDCGKDVTVRAHLLKRAKYCSLQCGVLSENQVKDIRGQRFGKLLAISRQGKDGGGKAEWVCQCDCGNTSVTTGDRLRSGITTSCGCVGMQRRIKHGRSRTREYKSERYMAYANAKRRSTSINEVDEKMVALYSLSRMFTKETGITHEVDHIIPLQGKTVSGLHVYENLRVVTRNINRRKSSSFYEIC